MSIKIVQLLTSPIHFSIFKLFLGYNNFTKDKNLLSERKINVIIFKPALSYILFHLILRSLELVHCSCKIGTIFLKTHVLLLPTKVLDWDLLRDFCNFIRNNNNTSLLIWDVWRNNFRAIPHQKINVHFKFLVKLLNIQKFQF